MSHKQYSNYAVYARDQCLGRGNILNKRLKVARFFCLSRASDSIIYRKNLKGHYGCVNAIEFSKSGGQFIVSGGDDKRVLLWNTQEAIAGFGKPVAMTSMHQSNIFCLAFDNENKMVVSGGNDQNTIIHNIESKSSIQTYLHEDVVYGLSVDPLNSNLLGTAGDDGRILIIDIRAPQSEGLTVLATSQNPMQGLRHNPMDPRIIASANSGDGTMLWDVRKPRCPIKKYASKDVKHSDTVMSVSFDVLGRRLAALRKFSGPVIYDIFDPNLSFEFKCKDYLNSCTMKSCTFAGEEDEYIISGSDDFNLYAWKVPGQGVTEVREIEDIHCILKGHRSIVNQVRYNPQSCLLISSGVEKIIKVWSPLPIGDGSEGSKSEPSREEYPDIELLPRPHTQGFDSPTAEDPLMLAFFDELIRRERIGDDVLPLEWYMSTFVEDQNSTTSSEETRVASVRLVYGDQETFNSSTSEKGEETSSEDDSDDGDLQVSGAISDVGLASDTGCCSRMAAEVDVCKDQTRKRTSECDEEYARTHWKKKRMDEMSTAQTRPKNNESLTTNPKDTCISSNAASGEDEPTDDFRSSKNVSNNPASNSKQGRNYRKKHNNDSDSEN